MAFYLNIAEEEVGSKRQETWRERNKSQAGGGGVEEKFRRGVLGRKGGVYMDMMWVAGLWFSWECEGESDRIMEVS